MTFQVASVRRTCRPGHISLNRRQTDGCSLCFICCMCAFHSTFILMCALYSVSKAACVSYPSNANEHE